MPPHADVSEIIKLSSPETHEYWEIPVLYEDEQLLAVDKPSGLLSSPDRYDPQRPNLMKLLHRDLARGASWVRSRQLTYLANAHRLDFETSGIMLLAKSKPTLVALADQFGSEKPLKTYVALVHGVPAQSIFDIEAKLALHPVKVGLMRIDAKKGKKAKTHVEVRERFRGYTLLECQPWTGRTHQIRVHLQSVKLFLVGDKVYGGPPLLLSKLKRGYRLKPGQEERPLIDRVALHAEQLTVRHPVTGNPISIVAPWPKDLKVALKYLRQYASLQ